MVKVQCNGCGKIMYDKNSTLEKHIHKYHNGITPGFYALSYFNSKGLQVKSPPKHSSKNNIHSDHIHFPL